MSERKSSKIAKYLCALLCVLIIIFPIYWMIIGSFKTQAEAYSFPPKLFPETLTLDNYINAFQEYNVVVYLKNSLIVTAFVVGLSVIIAALAAYAMSFFRFKLKTTITTSLYLLQLLPTITMLVPLFSLYRVMGLQNTYASLIITYVASVSGVPIALVLMSGYFSSIPKELFESAGIDGAGTMRTFVKILLPLAAPGIVCTAIYIFVQTWQEFMFAVNLVTDPDMYTLPVGLQMFVGLRTTDWGGMMATSTMIAIPAIILFVCVQNYFVDNLAGAVKQ